MLEVLGYRILVDVFDVSEGDLPFWFGVRWWKRELYLYEFMVRHTNFMDLEFEIARGDRVSDD